MSALIAVLAIVTIAIVSVVGWQGAAEDRDLYKRMYLDADAGWGRAIKVATRCVEATDADALIYRQAASDLRAAVASRRSPSPDLSHG